MGGDPETRAVELTLQAEEVVLRGDRWSAFLRKAIDALAWDPEPDGQTRFVAPVTSGYSGCLLNEVYPWRIFYQLANPDRLIIVAIAPHPTRM